MLNVRRQVSLSLLLLLFIFFAVAICTATYDTKTCLPVVGT
jgi:hypothetical protein